MDPSFLVGKSWEPGGRGPEAFDCWGLAMYWTKQTTGVDLPEFAITPDQTLAVAKQIEKSQLMDCWEALPQPQEGCLVSMGKSKTSNHIGIFVGQDLVLHCSQDAGKVIVQTLGQLRRSWNQVKFYKFKP